MKESKPRNLIILGNGFDLDLGLDTSFASFVKSYEFRQLPWSMYPLCPPKGE